MRFEVVGTTHTAGIEDISAAGVDVEALVQTPAADAAGLSTAGVRRRTIERYESVGSRDGS